MVFTGQALASRGQKGGFFLSVLGIILVVFGAAALILVAAAVFFFYVCSARGGEKIAESIIASGLEVPEAPNPLTAAGWAFYENAEKCPVETVGFDGTRLCATFIPREGALQTVICIHGYRARCASNFASALPDLYRLRSNILLIEQRGCGISGGKYITFGMTERYDVLTWIDWLNRETDGNLPIFLDGISLGGATVLMALELNLPDNVAGVIDDCGYTSEKDILTRVCRDLVHIPAFPLVNLIGVVNKIVTGLWLDEVDGSKCVKKARVPVFFAHGKRDNLVPVEQGIKNYEACPGFKMLIISENAGHGTAFLEDHGEYVEKLTDFFEKCRVMYYKKAGERVE